MSQDGWGRSGGGLFDQPAGSASLITGQVIAIAGQCLFYALFIWAMGFALSSKPATLVAGYPLIAAAIYGE